MTRLPGPPFHLLLIPFLLVGLALIFGGCASSATVARKSVTAMYTAIGATAVVSRPAFQQCNAAAVALVQANHDQDGNAAIAKCSTARDAVATALYTCEDATTATASAIDAAESIAAKDYTAALLPLLQAGASLVKALQAAGVKIPVTIPTGGL